MAKMVNFGIAYGMSDFGLSSRANIGRKEAQEFINTYFATYSGISYYMLRDQGAGPDGQGFVTTLIGRRRHIPELAARNPALRSAPASGWPSTCRSRARPPTSSRSR